MTVLSVVAQILMTRKYVENWILWVVINVISVNCVCCARGLRHVYRIRNSAVHRIEWHASMDGNCKV